MAGSPGLDSVSSHRVRGCRLCRGLKCTVVMFRLPPPAPRMFFWNGCCPASFWFAQSTRLNRCGLRPGWSCWLSWTGGRGCLPDRAQGLQGLQTSCPDNPVLPTTPFRKLFKTAVAQNARSRDHAGSLKSPGSIHFRAINSHRTCKETTGRGGGGPAPGPGTPGGAGSGCFLWEEAPCPPSACDPPQQSTVDLTSSPGSMPLGV